MKVFQIIALLGTGAADVSAEFLETGYYEGLTTLKLAFYLEKALESVEEKHSKHNTIRGIKFHGDEVTILKDDNSPSRTYSAPEIFEQSGFHHQTDRCRSFPRENLLDGSPEADTWSLGFGFLEVIYKLKCKDIKKSSVQHFRNRVRHGDNGDAETHFDELPIKNIFKDLRGQYLNDMEEGLLSTIEGMVKIYPKNRTSVHGARVKVTEVRFKHSDSAEAQDFGCSRDEHERRRKMFNAEMKEKCDKKNRADFLAFQRQNRTTAAALEDREHMRKLANNPSASEPGVHWFFRTICFMN